MPSSRSLSDEVRRRVAGWRCEYCSLHEEQAGYPHHIDHVISRKHGGDDSLENLAFACAVCNRNKGSDVAGIGLSGAAVRLFDPRRQVWAEHFRFEGPIIVPLTDIGELTVRLLRFNDSWRVHERSLLREAAEAKRARR